MRKVSCFLLALASAPLWAQLTPEQKISDFLNLAGLYAKNYAPYEWKRDVFHFDLLNLQPWLDRVAASKDDLDFYDVCVRYVAGLKSGGHDRFLVPSSFTASLSFTVDIYEGATLVDSINRARLPEAAFPFQIGDELVSVDGKPTGQLITELEPYGVVSSPGAIRRSAAESITTRSQQRIPRAVDLGDTAQVVVRRQNGDLESYTIPWVKTGIPLKQVGPVPNSLGPRAAFELPDEPEPEYVTLLRELQHVEADASPAVLGFGAIAPVFAMPDGFVQRLGRNLGDEFFSGTYQAEGHRIGFIRIPSFAPGSQARAEQQFAGEIAYFQANTDGLVVDDMRNPGGFVNYVNLLAQYLMPARFRSLGFELRATSLQVERFSAALQQARSRGADAATVGALQAILDGLVQANAQNRGRTGPLPVDGVAIERDPATDAKGNVVAYTKPLIVLVDEYSASGGDAFPATLQDNGRGPIVGMPTMGLGGAVSDVNATTYSEALTRITTSLMNRKNPISADGYPMSYYVENVGVRPDIALDYMTRENLLMRGKPFVAAFTNAVLELIR